MGKQITLTEMILECEKEIDERRKRGQESLASGDRREDSEPKHRG